MQNQIITIGSSLEDLAFFTQEGLIIANKKDLLRQKLLAFELGAKIKTERTVFSWGGGGMNTAISFVGFGFKTGLITAIGQDERGKKIFFEIKKNKINPDLIEIVANKKTDFSFVIASKEAQNEHVIFSDHEASLALKISKKQIKALKKASWVYLTSLYGDWKNNLIEIFQAVKGSIAWNIGSNQLKSGIKFLKPFLEKTTVLILNKDEAIELALSDSKLKNKNQFNQVDFLLKTLKNFGPLIVVITDGSNGAYAIDQEKTYFQPIIKERKRVDTTGAGDAFGSAFIAGLNLYQNNIALALKLGARNSASIISKFGAQNGLIKTINNI